LLDIIIITSRHGKEDGSVTIYDIPTGTKARKLFNHSSSSAVIKLVWSDSDKYLASADDSGRIIAKRLEPPNAAKSKWAVFPLLDFRIEEAVECFLFSPRDQYLLVAGPTTARVMGLKFKEEISRERHSPKGGVWMNHATDPTILVHI
jgi:WD40 repeat protein